MVQRGRDFVRRRTGQELLHTKSPRLRLLRLHGLLRSSLFLIFRLFTSFLLDDRLQAAGDAVDFAVSAFVGSEIDILVTMVEDGVRVAALAVPVAPVPAKRQPLNRFLFPIHLLDANPLPKHLLGIIAGFDIITVRNQHAGIHDRKVAVGMVSRVNGNLVILERMDIHPADITQSIVVSAVVDHIVPVFLPHFVAGPVLLGTMFILSPQPDMVFPSNSHILRMPQSVHHSWLYKILWLSVGQNCT